MVVWSSSEQHEVAQTGLDRFLAIVGIVMALSLSCAFTLDSPL